MKKKLLSLMLILVMVLGLAACGTKDDKKTDDEGKNTDVEQSNDADSSDDADAEVEKDADTSLAYIEDRGKLILGLDDSFPPMGFRDDENNIVGFDIDLAQAVADKMGVELVLQPIEWKAKEQEFSNKEY